MRMDCEKMSGADSWRITVRQKEFVPDSVTLSKSMTPVRRPGIRGGVYFSETEVYKIVCLVRDTCISSLLTSVMLGPSTDFVPVKITAVLDGAPILMQANLASYVQSADGIRLTLIIVDVSA